MGEAFFLLLLLIRKMGRQLSINWGIFPRVARLTPTINTRELAGLFPPARFQMRTH